MAEYQPHELRPLMARIPESLRHKIEQSAAKAGRSLNAELIYRLEQSYAKDSGMERRINSATQEVVNLATQQATTAVIEALGPRLDDLMKIASRR